MLRGCTKFMAGHQLTVEARDRPAMTSLRLLTVLSVVFQLRPHCSGNWAPSAVAHAFLRAVSPFVATLSPVVADALSVPRRDSSRRLGRFGCPGSSGPVVARVSPNTVHLAATDARIAPWDSELDAKVVRDTEGPKSRSPGCDMSRPYMADGAMRGNVRWFHDSLSERYWR